MEIPEIKYRNLYINDDIDSKVVGETIKAITEINYDDQIKAGYYANFIKEPIYLHINSYGGSVYDGLALVDVIKQSKTPVYTVSIGSSMSMGLWLFLAGHKRLIGQNATLMFHDLTTGYRAKTEQLKEDLTEGRRLLDMYIKEIMSRSIVSKSMLDDYITRKADWYLSASEAIELKLADEYFK